VKSPIASILGLACAASILTSSSAGAATRPIPLDVPAGPTTYTETPAWADSFVDSIGVDSAFEDRRYPPAVTTALEWSGIRHLRDSGATSQLMINTFANLGQHGIRHSIGMVRGFDPNDLKARLDAFAPYVDFVEGANEADNFANPNYAQMNSDQVNLWNVIHSNPAYAKVAVYGPSFANPLKGVNVTPLDAVENFAQLHNSTCDWNPGTTLANASIAANTAKIRLSSAYKPIVTTETGFSDNFTRGCSLNDTIIAKYVPRTSAERWLAGESRTYFDILTDNPTDPVFGLLGLLKVDGTPKPQFLAEGNLIHILSDKGVAPLPRTISFGISGATPDVHHLMLSRKDGSYDLMLWRELPAWDHFGHKAIPIAALPVTVQIPSTTSWVGLFQVNANYGYTRTQLPVTSSNGVTATFNVSDSISVLHIYGRGRAAMGITR